MPPPSKADREFGLYFDGLAQGLVIGGLCGLAFGVIVCSFF